MLSSEQIPIRQQNEVDIFPKVPSTQQLLFSVTAAGHQVLLKIQHPASSLGAFIPYGSLCPVIMLPMSCTRWKIEQIVIGYIH